MKRYFTILGFVAFLTIAPAATLSAGAHTWRLGEVFSNADGTIQFIELFNFAGLPNETFIGGRDVTSDSTLSSYVFPSNLPPGTNTSTKRILLATAGFALLPGAPTPDHIINDGFIDTGGDTLRYSPVAGYHVFPFTAGQLPTDGINSIQITDPVTNTFVTGPNTPTNCNGDTATIDANPPPACTGDCATPNDGQVNVTDLLKVLADWGGPGLCDTDGSGSTNVTDLLDILGQWGACP